MLCALCEQAFTHPAAEPQIGVKIALNALRAKFRQKNFIPRAISQKWLFEQTAKRRQRNIVTGAFVVTPNGLCYEKGPLGTTGTRE